jgi:hypothetical protein
VSFVNDRRHMPRMSLDKYLRKTSVDANKDVVGDDQQKK